MTTVVVSPFDVVSFPDGAGHFWVYMQYVQGLRRIGCDVYWLEQVQRGKHRDSGALATFREKVGTAAAPFPDCGLAWRHIRPPVCLELWPYVHDQTCESFTTVAGWWSGKWVKLRDNGKEVCIDNNKRVAFLEFAELAGRTTQPLELALHLAEGDGGDRRVLEQRRWRVRHAREVASTPQQYQSYIH